MRRLAGCVIGLCAVLSAWGCQTMGQPVTETTVDQELITQPAPSTPPPEINQDEARPGFQQEPPKSQEP